MSFWSFGKKSEQKKTEKKDEKTEKDTVMTRLIPGSMQLHRHVYVNEDGQLVGLPEEWEKELKDLYSSNWMVPTEDNLEQAINVGKTSIKRKKTLREGFLKTLKLLKTFDADSDSSDDDDDSEDDGDVTETEEDPEPAPMRRKKSGFKLSESAEKEILLELQGYCMMKNPWTHYHKVCPRSDGS